MKINTGKLNINIEVSGQLHGSVVLMAHSLGCNLNMWAPQMAMLEPHYKVVRLDMRGHGLSDTPAGPYSLDELADDVIAVMDHQGIDKAHWVGLSVGGMIGQSLLIRYPDRFHSAVLCDTASSQPAGAEQLWLDRIAKVESDGLGSIVEGTMERWFTPAFLASGSPACDQVRQQLATTPDAGYAACSRAIMNLDYLDRLSSISTNVALIVGAEDIATPVAASQAMHEQLPNSQLNILENASHISNVEQADAFNAVLVSFLQANAASRSV